MAALVFAIAVLYQHRVTEIREKPLVAELSDVTMDLDENGVMHFVISGRVVNRSDQIYGVPGLVAISYDSNGNVVARQRFMPSATLLDAGDNVGFMHTLSVPVSNIDRIAVELETQGD